MLVTCIVARFLMLANLVTVIPSKTVIPLAAGSASAEVIFRNVSEVELLDVRLTSSAKNCEVEVSPERFPSVRPADRVVFRIAVKQTPQTGINRFPLEGHFSSQLHPDLGAFQIIVDPQGQTGQEDGWIDVGSIQITQRKTWVVQLGYILLGVVPVVLLLGWGYWLKKKSSRS